jgi:uncharacterized protein YdaU (DUF1376 family)
MAKGKQPYIPLYIGDWIQDTDCLSIEAEGAWLRIIFKCWKNNGMFSATIDVFARVCKVSEQTFASILLEWKTNNICDVVEGDKGIITVLSRRIRRDKEISAIRSEVGSKGGSKTQAKVKANSKAKQEQTPDNDIEIDNEDEIVIEYKEESEQKAHTVTVELPRGTIDFTKPDVDGDEIIFPIDTPAARELWSGWKRSRWENHNARYGIMGEQADLKRLHGMNFQQIEQTILAAISGKWKNLYPEKNGGSKTTKRTDEVNARREAFARKYGSSTSNK